MDCNHEVWTYGVCVDNLSSLRECFDCKRLEQYVAKGVWEFCPLTLRLVS
jgi:hypothetical protein